MELCSNNHDEICFDSHYCPMCNMRDDSEDRIAELEDEISELKNTNSKLEDEIAELNNTMLILRGE